MGRGELNFTMDKITQEEIKHIIAVQENCDIAISKGIREIWFVGDNSTELRILFLGHYRLTISRVNFERKRCGTMTKILFVLIDFCKKNNIQKIIVRSVETKEMASFCLKHHFIPDKNSSFEIDGIIYGDYILYIENT